MKNKLLLIICTPLILASCKNSEAIIGVKQQAEKCNGTTGYQWSTIKNDCIRVFEQTILLKSVTKEPMETICALIFNEQNNQVEVFASTAVILDKISTDNFEGLISSKKYNLKKSDNKWQLTIDNILVYTE